MVNDHLFQVQKLTIERDAIPLFAPLTFTLSPGNVLHIQGDNGSGKTSLILCLLGLLPRTTGQVVWQGQLVEQDWTRFYQDTTFVGHQNGVNPRLTPRECLSMSLHPRQSTKATDITAALEANGLLAFADDPCALLSAGQQRRVTLARLNLACTSLWLLDEPLNTLDRESSERLMHLLRQHVSNGGMALITSHQCLPSPIESLQHVRLRMVA